MTREYKVQGPRLSSNRHPLRRTNAYLSEVIISEFSRQTVTESAGLSGTRKGPVRANMIARTASNIELWDGKWCVDTVARTHR